MLRNRVRRPFTVEAKASGQTRFVSIPSKLPPAPRAGQAGTGTPWPPSDPAAVFAPASVEPPAEQRRVLPNLLVPEPQAPEPEPVVEPEVLPRVRRVTVPAPSGEAPRRRGRPHKPQPAEPAVTEASHPGIGPDALTPAPAAAAPPSPTILRRRLEREGSERLSRAERWKRRLPRACW